MTSSGKKSSAVNIDVFTNDPGVIYELVKQIFKKGYVVDDYEIDLTNASKDNPVSVRLLSQLDVVDRPPHQYSSSAYTFHLTKDSQLYLYLYSGRDTDIINSRIELVLSKNLKIESNEDIYIRDNNKKHRSSDIASKLSIVFMNREKIENNINRINLFSQEKPPVDNAIISFSRDIIESMSHSYRLNNIIRILKYDHYIDTIENVPHQQQCEVVNFLIENLKAGVTYTFKDFTILKKNRGNTTIVKFLGIPIAIFEKDNPPQSYFKYFRHRGISFLANVVRENRDEFEQRIHMLSLKHDVGV